MFTSELRGKDNFSVASSLLFHAVLFLSLLIVAGAGEVPDVGTEEADPSLTELAVLAHIPSGVVQVQLAVLNDEVAVGFSKVRLILGADSGFLAALAVHEAATDVELKASLYVSVLAGPLVVGPGLLEAAQVVSEACVRVRHSTPLVDSSPDRTGGRVSPLKPPQTVRRVNELRLGVRDTLITLEVDDGLLVGPGGVVSAWGAQFVLQEHLIVLRVKLEAAILNLPEVFMSHLTS